MYTPLTFYPYQKLEMHAVISSSHSFPGRSFEYSAHTYFAEGRAYVCTVSVWERFFLRQMPGNHSAK
jgi:hypothetical protein